LIELISLRLRNLEQLRNIEEELALLVFGEHLSLVKKKDNFIKEGDALLFFECLIIEDIGLLHKCRFREVAVRVLVLARIISLMALMIFLTGESRTYKFYTKLAHNCLTLNKSI